jgi:hypothetical protein
MPVFFIVDVEEVLAKYPELRFLVTKIGCGVAKFKPEQIAPLFTPAAELDGKLTQVFHS